MPDLRTYINSQLIPTNFNKEKFIVLRIPKNIHKTFIELLENYIHVPLFLPFLNL